MMTAERSALKDLVQFLADQEPHFGWDLSEINITYQQAGIVLAAEPEEVMDGVVDFQAENKHFIAKLACHPGGQSDELSAEYERDLCRKIVHSAKEHLLYLLKIESERREEVRRGMTREDFLPQCQMDDAR